VTLSPINKYFSQYLLLFALDALDDRDDARELDKLLDNAPVPLAKQEDSLSSSRGILRYFRYANFADRVLSTTYDMLQFEINLS